MRNHWLGYICPILEGRGYPDAAFCIRHFLTHEPWWRYWVFAIDWHWVVPGEAAQGVGDE